MTDIQASAHPIWEILKFRGQSLVWLARKTGYSVETVKGYKCGAWPISAKFRAKAVEAMDIPEHHLFLAPGSPDEEAASA